MFKMSFTMDMARVSQCNTVDICVSLLLKFKYSIQTSVLSSPFSYIQITVSFKEELFIRLMLSLYLSICNFSYFTLWFR